MRICPCGSVASSALQFLSLSHFLSAIPTSAAGSVASLPTLGDSQAYSGRVCAGCSTGYFRFLGDCLLCPGGAGDHHCNRKPYPAVYALSAPTADLIWPLTPARQRRRVGVWYSTVAVHCLSSLRLTEGVCLSCKCSRRILCRGERREQSRAALYGQLAIP
jgi:hypothetical protein